MRFLLFAVVVLASARADAAMMPHYDLAGLVLESDAIVTAEKLGTAGQEGRYRITRVVRGGATVGDEIAVHDSLYATTNDAGETADPNVYLFLHHAGGKPHIVSSGMRVIVKGKVYRFEQWSNPGGFRMIPQGTDPVDNWRANTGPVDVATFEQALGSAMRRVDAFAGVRALPDAAQRRAMLLALLGLPGARAPSVGFYTDALAEEVTQTLASAGDLEGALMAFARDRSFASIGRGFGTLPELVGIAKDAGKSIDLRISALAVASNNFGFYEDIAAVHGVIALFDDPEARVRATAVAAASRTFGVMSSDAKTQATIRKLVAEARTAMEKRLAKETDDSVLFALAEALGNTAPSRTTGPLAVAVAHVQTGMIMASVRCLSRGHKYRDGKVLATRDGKPDASPRFNLSYSCGTEQLGTFSAASTPLPAGRYDVSVELRLDGKTIVLHAGEVYSE